MIRQLIETFDRDRDMIETIANSVRSLCKHHFEEEFSSKLELLEHLQRQFKCVINDTQRVVCKTYFRRNRGMNQHLIRSKCQSIMLKQDPNAVFPDQYLPNKGSNPVSWTGQDNHHSAQSRNGKEEARANLGKWNKKDPIRWPRMSDQVKWSALENSVYLQLPTYGPIVKKIRMLEMILYEEAYNLFGAIKKEMNIRELSRRLKQIKDIRNKRFSKNYEELFR